MSLHRINALAKRRNVSNIDISSEHIIFAVARFGELLGFFDLSFPLLCAVRSLASQPCARIRINGRFAEPRHFLRPENFSRLESGMLCRAGDERRSANREAPGKNILTRSKQLQGSSFHGCRILESFAEVLFLCSHPNNGVHIYQTYTCTVQRMRGEFATRRSTLLGFVRSRFDDQ